jgi:immunoglobulin-binding protein 1
MADEEPQSLRSLFQAAETARLTLERTTPSTFPDYVSTLSSTIDLYTTCLTQISRLSLFSPNESAEDISTSDLPYLLVSYHLADLLQRQTPANPTPAARKTILASAREAYERFLHLLDSYNFLSSTDARLLERYTDEPKTFTTVPPNADGAARRNAKIANFKTEKELKSKLEFLRNRPGYGDGETGEGDEELVRKVHLAHLSYAAHMTFQALEGLTRESEVLDMAPEPTQPTQILTPQALEDERIRQRTNNGFSERLDDRNRITNHTGPLLSGQGKPLRPFTLLGNRQELAKGVFRPGHNLPTMSIDEYLEEERARGGIIEGGGEASWARPEPDEDDEAKADAETYKARAWDEYTEANAKGSGNTLNRG